MIDMTMRMRVAIFWSTAVRLVRARRKVRKMRMALFPVAAATTTTTANRTPQGPPTDDESYLAPSKKARRQERGTAIAGGLEALGRTHRSMRRARKKLVSRLSSSPASSMMTGRIVRMSMIVSCSTKNHSLWSDTKKWRSCSRAVEHHGFGNDDEKGLDKGYHRKDTSINGLEMRQPERREEE